MDSIRQAFEERERNFISPYGCLSFNSKGRMVDEESCPIRSVFQVDKTRIVYSNAFRRLKHKTQVFFVTLGRRIQNTSYTYIGSVPNCQNHSTRHAAE